MTRMAYDLEKQVENVTKALQEGLYGMIRYDCFCLQKLCESPIEVQLGAAILGVNRMDQYLYGQRIILCGPKEITDYREDMAMLVPQYEWRGYRIDFALRLPEYRFKWVFIECDGHNFHERTKEQAANDRQKDRDIQASGFPILRFTGSEIHASPFDCANQFFDFLTQRVDDWIPWNERNPSA